ncbi:MAG: hypothetical protein JSV99_09685 [Planctomycetota bacterium]|nr:MAG: hypothetical protein JSV99_09685 [Planctomycetota bacterium]
MTFNTLNQIIDQNYQASVNFPADTDILFSNHKNIYKPRIEKRQRKLLQKITFLPPFMHQGERVLHVTTACSPVSFGEQILTGAIVFVIKRSLFVFTDRRIFHIPTKSNFSYRGSIAQILYADCQKIYTKGRTLIAEYKNGTKERFTCIASREKAKVKALLKSISLDGQQSQAQQRTHLCPRCTNPLVENNFTCPACRLHFKSKTRARRLSIIYPGGGYFYTRHPYFGIADALVETYLLLLLLVALLALPESLFAVIFLAAILTIEKSITVYHANRYVAEYIPLQPDVQPNKNYRPQALHHDRQVHAQTAPAADNQQTLSQILSAR